MNFEFERTISDFLDFNIFHMTHSPRHKKVLFAARIITALMMGVFFFVPTIIVSNLVFSSIVTRFLIVGIAFGIGIYGFIDFPRLNRQGTRRRLQKELADSGNKTLFGHTVTSFSADGIASKTDFGESKIKWSAINKVTRSKTQYLFYTSLESAIIIPKRCFHSAKEEEEFIDFINTCRQQSL